MPKDIGLDEMRRLVDEGAQVVELLPRREYDEEHSPGDVNIPLKALNETTAAQLDKTRPVSSIAGTARSQSSDDDGGA